MILGFDRCVKDKWALGMGACHPPLQGLNHELLQLLTFNTPLNGVQGTKIEYLMFITGPETINIC